MRVRLDFVRGVMEFRCSGRQCGAVWELWVLARLRLTSLIPIPLPYRWSSSSVLEESLLETHVWCLERTFKTINTIYGACVSQPNSARTQI